MRTTRFTTIRNYITLKHAGEINCIYIGFTTIRNYITLKLNDVIQTGKI